MCAVAFSNILMLARHRLRLLAMLTTYDCSGMSSASYSSASSKCPAVLTPSAVAIASSMPGVRSRMTHAALAILRLVSCIFRFTISRCLASFGS